MFKSVLISTMILIILLYAISEYFKHEKLCNILFYSFQLIFIIWVIYSAIYGF